MREETNEGRDNGRKRCARKEARKGRDVRGDRNMQGKERARVQGAREETRVGRDVRGKRCVREEMGRGIEDA